MKFTEEEKILLYEAVMFVIGDAESQLAKRALLRDRLLSCLHEGDEPSTTLTEVQLCSAEHSSGVACTKFAGHAGPHIGNRDNSAMGWISPPMRDDTFTAAVGNHSTVEEPKKARKTKEAKKLTVITRLQCYDRSRAGTRCIKPIHHEGCHQSRSGAQWVYDPCEDKSGNAVCVLGDLHTGDHRSISRQWTAAGIRQTKLTVPLPR